MEDRTITKNEINKSLIKFKGVYFVYHIIKDNQVLYVGYSQNIYKRLKDHKYLKEFDCVRLFPAVSLIECRILERADIFKLKPVLSRSGKDKFEFPSDKSYKPDRSELFKFTHLLNRTNTV